jgi:hypothetical protein
MRLSELSFWAFIAGFVIFLFDWSGYDKWQPSLFFPKDLEDIWWHLPLEIAGVFVIVRIHTASADQNKGDG